MVGRRIGSRSERLRLKYKLRHGNYDWEFFTGRQEKKVGDRFDEMLSMTLSSNIGFREVFQVDLLVLARPPAHAISIEVN